MAVALAAVIALTPALGARAAPVEPPQGPTAGGTAVTVEVPGAGFVAVSAGDNHSLALSGDGVVYAWGSNSDGQLGRDGDGSQQPVVVTALAGITVTAVSAGTNFSLALTDDGTVYSWGLNDAGQLGRAGGGDGDLPGVVGFPEGTQIVSIDAGSWKSAVAIDDAGNAWAWGLNTYGQLGDGGTTSRMDPALVELPETATVTQIFAGTYFTAALDSDGQVWVWGRNNWGQLGNGTAQASTAHPVPQAVVFDPAVTVNALAAGDGHVMALAGNGVYTWGRNAEGQLARDVSDADLRPGPVDGLNGVTAAAQLSAGFGNSMVRTAAGVTYIWGWNNCSQIGDGTGSEGCDTAQGSGPQVRVPTLVTEEIATIDGGYMHVLATTGDGSAYAWGYNSDGQAAPGNNPITTPEPIPLPVVTEVTFGGVPAADLERVSATPTQFVATTPAHDAAVVDVVATVADLAGTVASTVTHPASFTFGTTPTVLTDPAPATADVDEPVSFHASAAADTAPTVVWEVLLPGETVWVAATGDVLTTVAGETVDSVLAITAAADLAGAQFRAVFTNPLGSATTSAAILDVEPPPTEPPPTQPPPTQPPATAAPTDPPVTPTPSTPTLPATGFSDGDAPVLLAAAIGAVLLVAAGVLLLLGSRRARTRPN